LSVVVKYDIIILEKTIIKIKMENSNEKPEIGPFTNEFLDNPKKVVEEINQALQSGSLAPEFVEERLAAVLDEARHVNKIHRSQDLQERVQTREQFKNALLARLATFDEVTARNLADILRKFCAENNLELMPEKGIAVRGIKDSEFKPDWISKKGKLAIIVKSDSVWVYTQVGNNWIATNLDNII